MPRAIPLLSICASIIAGWGPAQAQPPLGPQEIRWSADRPLRWSDFQGGTNPDAHAENVAMTAASIGWGYEVDLEWGRRSCAYRISAFEAHAVFDRAASWVRPGHETAAVLAHEQGHFDIAQIFKLRLDERARVLLAVPGACEGVSIDAALEHADERANAKLSALGNAVWREHLAAQQAYDDRTAHGLRLDAQGRWSESIARALRGEPWQAPAGAHD